MKQFRVKINTEYIYEYDPDEIKFYENEQDYVDSTIKFLKSEKDFTWDNCELMNVVVELEDDDMEVVQR